MKTALHTAGILKERHPTMIGLHVNDKTAPYTTLILAALKTLETRFKPTLRPFIGQRVAIIRTGKGPAAIVGTVDIVAEEWIPRASFWNFESQHLVPRGSACDVGTRAGKWAYRLENPRPLPEPIVIGSQYYTGNRTYRRLPLEF